MHILVFLFLEEHRVEHQPDEKEKVIVNPSKEKKRLMNLCDWQPVLGLYFTSKAVRFLSSLPGAGAQSFIEKAFQEYIIVQRLFFPYLLEISDLILQRFLPVKSSMKRCDKGLAVTKYNETRWQPLCYTFYWVYNWFMAVVNISFIWKYNTSYESSSKDREYTILDTVILF